MARYRRMVTCFQGKPINYLFSVLGGTIAKHPVYFLVVPIVTTALLSGGMLLMKINRDQDWLVSDSNGKAARSKRLVETLFPLNTSVYVDEVRTTSAENVTIVIMTAKDGGSVLREEVMREVAIIDKAIRSVEVEWRGNLVNYSTLCGKIFGACQQGNLNEVISNFEGIRTGQYKIKYPVSINKLTFSFKEYISLLGGTKLDGHGFVRDVAALRVFYVLDYSDNDKHEAINQWQSLVYEYASTSKFDYVDFVCVGKESIHKSFEELMFAILKDLPYVVGALILFSALTCMTDSWVTSKPAAGICACISAGLAVVSGLGLGSILGIPYMDYFPAIAYISLAIEIDDAFMLIASWRNTNPYDTVSERMEKAFYHATTSISITSLTNVASCLIGITAPFPSFRLNCAMSALCSFFAYVYLITFFGACLALSGYMEEKARRSTVNSKRREARSNDETAQKKLKGDIFMSWFRKSIGVLLTYPVAKAIIIVLLLINFSIGIWGWSYIKFGDGLGTSLPANSSVVKYLRKSYGYFSNYAQPIHVVIKDTVNYADRKVQSSIESLIREFESHPHVVDASLRISWLKYYNTFAEVPAGKILLRGYNMSDKQDFIDGLHYVFLRFPPAQQFKTDIVFNRNYTDIIVSRFLLTIKDINSSDTEIRAIQDFYRIASKSELPVEIFGVTFSVLEHAWIIKDVTIQTGCIATTLCCLLFFVFSRDIKAALCITIVVLCIVCELIGFLSLWGVQISTAVVIVFLISVGVSINYPLHMAFTFVSTNAESNESIKNAIYLVGFPSIQGTFSTILGLLVFNFQIIHTVISAFKVLCLIVLLSTLNSLFVTPVLLALFGVSEKPANGNNSSETPLSLNSRMQSTNGFAEEMVSFTQGKD